MSALAVLGMSAVCSVVPMVCFLGAIWWLDRYDREPAWLIAATFLWGALGAIPIAIMGGSILQAALALLLEQRAVVENPEAWLMVLGPALVAPVVEEPAKALLLVGVIWNRSFDNMTDGFVYGAAAGLGFAMVENFLYFLGSGGDMFVWSFTVLIRTFYSAVMHATATSIVGAALGYGRFRGIPVLMASGAAGLVVAGAIHALWNGLIAVGPAGFSTDLFWLDLVIFPAELLLVFIVFEICVFDEARIIRRELTEEVRSGLVPASHPKILASWLVRLTHDWGARGIDGRTYVAACTALAMRKHQLRLLGAHAPGFYQSEIDTLRATIQTQLEAAA